jgi:DNA-binding transcriptional ArsR family regulator
VNRERRQAVQARTREVLEWLSEPERQLRKRILQIEHEHVHQQRFYGKEDMLCAVRETIK